MNPLWVPVSLAFGFGLGWAVGWLQCERRWVRKCLNIGDRYEAARRLR